MITNTLYRYLGDRFTDLPLKGATCEAMVIITGIGLTSEQYKEWQETISE